MHKITIYDVAKSANCSTATVSLVLQNDQRVKPETRERVLAVVERLKYTPNYMAQSLSKKSTNTLGLIVPNLENPIFAQMICGVEECANDRGYNLILGVPNFSKEKEETYVDMLQQRRVDGLLIFPTFTDEIAERLNGREKKLQTPIVFCGSSVKKLPEISCVRCDNRMGAYMAVDHLITMGKKRIGFILAVINEQQSLSRRTGYQDALFFHEIPYDPHLLKTCQPQNEAVYRATMELIEQEHVDAIFCLYDYIAITVMHAIVNNGRRIPEDIAVIGYDNIHLSEYLPIPLSTIDTHSQRVGRMSTEILLDTIENPDTPARQIVLKPDLVIRKSTDINSAIQHDSLG